MEVEEEGVCPRPTPRHRIIWVVMEAEEVVLVVVVVEEVGRRGSGL